MFNLGAFLSYVFVVSFTPGPNNIMSMANASKVGYKKTLDFILGVCTGFFIIILLSGYFNLLLFNLIPKVKIFMGILGAGYMTYLAFKIINSKEKTDNNNEEEITDENNLNSFLNGILMQFVNPKAILFGITVVSNFIIPYYKSNVAIILFSIFLAFVGFLSTSCWALFGSLFNKFLSKYRRQFNMTMGLFLIYSAFSISGVIDLFYK
ncbi:LysE family transporter [Maledivibacter halophilus]|uniref:Threonine/homoserine/homoserine lactone efflux protein n=1 Tax=Maledivibacter halophilus TaxID=36842 RepID=A0A1T5MNF7_9FIRM|nr:LysE family transporter [Maledivibacter halophilus]SKC89745.1 Threonine/homoserine/homoserine lactone efflux protein [Maledivibacter halophilus]